MRAFCTRLRPSAHHALSGLATLLAFANLHCREDFPFSAHSARTDVFRQSDNVDEIALLWVMDNSSSMLPRREYVKNNLRIFLDQVQAHKSVRYQMAVTTTDYYTDKARLIKNSGGVDVVQSFSPDPVAAFGTILDNISDSNTAFWEQGLRSSKEAIELYGSRFINSGWPLFILFITDADDYSCQSGKCWGGPPESHPDDWTAFSIDYYVEFFSHIAEAEKRKIFLFPIVGASKSSCKVAVGYRYLAVQERVGVGTKASVCEGEFPESLRHVGAFMSDLGRCFKLSSPIASRSSLSVYVNSIKIEYSESDGFTYDSVARSVCFHGRIPQNGSIMEVTYTEGNL